MQFQFRKEYMTLQNWNDSSYLSNLPQLPKALKDFAKLGRYDAERQLTFFIFNIRAFNWHEMRGKKRKKMYSNYECHGYLQKKFQRSPQTNLRITDLQSSGTSWCKKIQMFLIEGCLSGLEELVLHLQKNLNAALYDSF